jgi:hypothetical protein
MRSKLFVPGSRPARKSEARGAVGGFLSHPRAGGPMFIVRINPLGTPDFDADLRLWFAPVSTSSTYPRSKAALTYTR